MKKHLSVAVISALFVMPAFATSSNMENPLYMPKTGEIYSKTTLGLMFKITDNTDNQRLRLHNGDKEFPIWRPQEDFGYGINDRWMVHGSIGYTTDPDIHRYGFHLGRMGTTYRVIDKLDGFIWDLYGDLHMGGIQKMKGKLNITARGPVFDYRNYSNGRWGYHVGTKFGKKWGQLTTSIFAEALRTWGNHNNRISLPTNELYAMYGVMLPEKVSVSLKSTWEVSAGANAFYEFNDKWSAGLGFRYNYHASNALKSVHDSLNMYQQMVANGIIEKFADMNDKFNEYIFNLTVAHQMTDYMQVAWYIEDTYDNGARLSSNSTDLKIETGLRLNLKF